MWLFIWIIVIKDISGSPVSTHTHARTHARTHTHPHTSTHARTYIHTHRCTCTRTCTPPTKISKATTHTTACSHIFCLSLRRPTELSGQLIREVPAVTLLKQTKQKTLKIALQHLNLHNAQLVICSTTKRQHKKRELYLLRMLSSHFMNSNAIAGYASNVHRCLTICWPVALFRHSVTSQ